jgi:hypothetical protein
LSSELIICDDAGGCDTKKDERDVCSKRQLLGGGGGGEAAVS